MHCRNAQNMDGLRKHPKRHPTVHVVCALHGIVVAGGMSQAAWPALCRKGKQKGVLMQLDLIGFGRVVRLACAEGCPYK